jgi:DNA replication protein DnaC
VALDVAGDVLLADLAEIAGAGNEWQVANDGPRRPSLDKNRIMALAELEFINRSEVVHFLGPPGTGKSHLSLALGVQAVKAGRSVYFTPLSDLVSALAKAEREGTLREKIRFFCRFSLLIVDEIGYLPVIPGGGNLFFQLVNARYEKGAMILTSNRGFAEWGEVFGDPVVATALLDHTSRITARKRKPTMVGT